MSCKFVTNHLEIGEPKKTSIWSQIDVFISIVILELSP